MLLLPTPVRVIPTCLYAPVLLTFPTPLLPSIYKVQYYQRLSLKLDLVSTLAKSLLYSLHWNLKLLNHFTLFAIQSSLLS